MIALIVICLLRTIPRMMMTMMALIFMMMTIAAADSEPRAARLFLCRAAFAPACWRARRAGGWPDRCPPQVCLLARRGGRAPASSSGEICSGNIVKYRISSE